MSTITVYTLESWSGEERDGYQTQNYQKAKRDAAALHLRVIANEYEFDDSGLIDDFTPEASRLAKLENAREAGELDAEETAELAGLESSRR